MSLAIAYVRNRDSNAFKSSNRAPDTSLEDVKVPLQIFVRVFLHIIYIYVLHTRHRSTR